MFLSELFMARDLTDNVFPCVTCGFAELCRAVVITAGVFLSGPKGDLGILVHAVFVKTMCFVRRVVFVMLLTSGRSFANAPRRGCQGSTAIVESAFSVLAPGCWQIIC